MTGYKTLFLRGIVGCVKGRARHGDGHLTVGQPLCYSDQSDTRIVGWSRYSHSIILCMVISFLSARMLFIRLALDGRCPDKPTQRLCRMD